MRTLERALALRGQGRCEEAFALLKAEPKPAAALRVLLGEVLRDLGARARGYGEVQAAVLADPSAAWVEDLLPALEPVERGWALGARGGGARLRGALPQAQADLEAAVEADPACGWAWGWLGETRLRQGDLDGAVTALDRAAALFSEWAQAYAWRGEALRQKGLAREALRDLDYAAALGLGQYDLFVSRSAVRAELGDAAGQERDLAQAVRLAPEVFRAQAKASPDASAASWLEGVISRLAAASSLLEKARALGAKGRWDRAMPLLDEALALDPDAAEALLTRSQARETQGELQTALSDADAAVKAEGSSRAYARRAELEQRLGLMEAGLRDVSLALALGPSVHLHRWRAQTFLGMRHYDLALRDVSAALERDPDDAGMYDLRASVNLILGRLAEAQEDVERALKLLPKSVNLRLRHAQVLALRGRFPEAHKAAAAAKKLSKAWAAFSEGYVWCIEKRYDKAQAAFKTAVLHAGEEEALKRQASMYGTVARAVAAAAHFKEDAMAVKTKKDAKAKGKVYLCGLGVYPPQTATVEVLRGISECDVIFNNLPGVGMSEFLGLFCSNRRPVAFRYEQDAQLCADLVLSEVRAGRTVGFVTFGHPLLFGPLSHEIIKRCKRDGVPCKAFGAVSSMDAVLAASGQVLGFSYGGFQLFETTGTKILDEIAKANTGLPVIVYFADGMGEQWLGQLSKALSKNYGPKHECLLYGPRHELWETQQERVTTSELGKLSHHKLAQGILFVPPL